MGNTRTKGYQYSFNYVGLIKAPGLSPSQIHVCMSFCPSVCACINPYIYILCLFKSCSKNLLGFLNREAHAAESLGRASQLLMNFQYPF